MSIHQSEIIEHLEQLKTTGSQLVLSQIFDAATKGNLEVLDSEIDKYRDHLNALAEIVSPYTNEYSPKFIEDLYRRFSVNAKHCLKSNLLVVPRNEYDKQADLLDMHITMNLGGRGFTTGRIVTSHQHVYYQKKQLNPWDPEVRHEEIHYQGHLFIGIDDDVYQLVLFLGHNELLASLSAVHEHVSHDYLHQTNDFLSKGVMIGAEELSVWKSGFGFNNGTESIECWHTEMHKRILDRIHQNGAIGSTHEHAMNYLSKLRMFKNDLDEKTDLNVEQKHDIVRYLGLCGAVTYTRVTGLDDPHLAEYATALEKVDYAEVSIKDPNVQLKQGPNAKNAYQNYLKSGLDLADTMPKEPYILRVQKDLLNFCPVLANLYSPQAPVDKDTLHTFHTFINKINKFTHMESKPRPDPVINQAIGLFHYMSSFSGLHPPHHS